MSHIAMSQYVLLRIQSLQEEVESLKKIVSHQLLQIQRKTTCIKGLWKDFEINDDDFADARRAILKEADPRPDKIKSTCDNFVCVTS